MSSRVAIGSGLRETLFSRVAAHLGSNRRAVLVGDERVLGLWPDVVAGARAASVSIIELPAGEAAKTRAVLERTQDALIDLRRDELIVALGGGAATDLGGFAAATLRRGLAWIAVPTTVVGMADAAHGGKTGINHPRGKNLIGAFHEPREVLVDVDFLTTLPPREIAAGAAEIYKSGRVGDDRLCARLASGLPQSADAAAWCDLIRGASDVKRALVAEDPRDGGARRLLNYGHTLGHALETLLGPERMRHGEAVAIGMMVAIMLAGERGLCSRAAARDQREGLAAIGLPVDVPAEAASGDLLQILALDKKRGAGAAHTFVLPTGEEGAVVVTDVATGEIERAIDATRPG